MFGILLYVKYICTLSCNYLFRTEVFNRENIKILLTYGTIALASRNRASSNLAALLFLVTSFHSVCEPDVTMKPRLLNRS